MSEDEIGAQLASIKTSLQHLHGDMEKARQDWRGTSRKLDGFLERLIILEAGERNLSSLPDKVTQNEKDNAVEKAMRETREHIITELKKTVGLWLSIPGVIVAVTAIIIAFKELNGP
jgi:transcriptional regulator of acetoin/glycerol metabolism